MAMLGLTDHTILTLGSFGLWSTILSHNFETKNVLLPRGYETLKLMSQVQEANFSNWKFI